MFREAGVSSTGRRPLRVAVACQGGGSHAAFTAGVLRGVLCREDIEVVGLSGASGGAVCALLAHYGLLIGGRERASEILRDFWSDNSARGAVEYVMNHFVVQSQRVEANFGSPSVSPYNVPEAARDELARLLGSYVDFEELDRGIGSGEGPRLIVGAAEVLTGEQRIFDSEAGEISLEAVLASCAVPGVFRAVEVEGDGLYWDGIYSENPPVRKLPDTGCDEIWVVQLDPSGRDEEPKTPAEITDRKNQLLGNLSLEHEIRAIDTINALVSNGNLVGTDHRYIPVRRIALPRLLDTPSRLDRHPSFIEQLIADGESEARVFLDGLGDIEVASSAATGTEVVKEGWVTRMPEAVRRFVWTIMGAGPEKKDARVSRRGE